ncbi:MAG: aminopeptidase P family N-terminal domain-containing protein [Desulfosarcina sp.]|nr:aminopeptidase P family N-terminal domain-containing protein [Desulfosarcina sp.]MBC2765181.1 hypothetical protein [Desulfosarcina sp.]
MNSIIQKRITKIRQTLVEKELDALMVSVQENRYYLSGFTGEDTQFDESAGVLIISNRHLVLATDSRYELQAQAEAVGFDIVCYKKSLEKELPNIANALGIHRLGFESVRLSHKNHSAYADALSKVNPSVQLTPTENMVETARHDGKAGGLGHGKGHARSRCPVSVISRNCSLGPQQRTAPRHSHGPQTGSGRTHPHRLGCPVGRILLGYYANGGDG